MGLGTPHFRGWQQLTVGEACTRCTEYCKKWVFELFFLFCLSWIHKCKSAYSFLSLCSYLNMYHGYPSLQKEHFWPVFTEKRAFFQHILMDTKSAKCELKKHLWERASNGMLRIAHCLSVFLIFPLDVLNFSEQLAFSAFGV